MWGEIADPFPNFIRANRWSLEMDEARIGSKPNKGRTISITQAY